MRSVVGGVLRQAGLDPISVENPAFPGTPDVNYVEGWLELKCEKVWPTREDTPLRVRHYTKEQKVWGIRRRLAGGRCHLLLQVRQDWLLFDSEVAREFLGVSPKKTLQRVARQVWRSKAEMQEGLVLCVFEPQNSLQANDYSSTGAGAKKPR